MARASAVPVSDDGVKLSAFQTRVLTIPEQYDIFCGGGRGGGKSFALALLALRHVEQYGARARCLYLRESHQGASDFEALALDLLGRAYGRGLRFNAQESVFRFPNGGSLEVGQLADEQSYASKQGRSFSLLLFDEIGLRPSPDLLDRMLSNLRGPEGMPLRVIYAANPAGAGHSWISRRWVFKAPAPWVPFTDDTTGRTVVYAPSVPQDNEFIDVAAYERSLRAACANDPELLKAWLLGDWAVARGAYFGDVLDERRNAVDVWPAIPKTYGTRWRTFIALDYGSAAPACVLLIAESPGATGPDGRFYPRDSLIVVDELATAEPGSYTRGLGWTVTRLGEEICEFCAKWKVKPDGCADDACFAMDGRKSIADELKAAGVTVWPAKKGSRVTGWTRLRQLLAAAGSPDQAGVYIARHCTYTWSTLPYLARDPRKIEDVDSRGADHAADALRYGVLRDRREVSVSEMWPAK